MVDYEGWSQPLVDGGVFSIGPFIGQFLNDFMGSLRVSVYAQVLANPQMRKTRILRGGVN